MLRDLWAPRIGADGGGGARRAQAARSRQRFTVTFAVLTPAQIRRYVESGEPLGKAGATRCRAGCAHISHIRGSYTGIMGLPLSTVAGTVGCRRILVCQSYSWGRVKICPAKYQLCSRTS